ncbi:hypothetical protein IWX90DRAFT_100921 [Phyllosticta citrichinensis]|uniref:Uncharacterized protein n=1 Tax=Phyllosticta citrichinensis TaxID=1130410 RepID=A0ABR1Y1U3_9PEZI
MRLTSCSGPTHVIFIPVFASKPPGGVLLMAFLRIMYPGKTIRTPPFSLRVLNSLKPHHRRGSIFGHFKNCLPRTDDQSTPVFWPSVSQQFTLPPERALVRKKDFHQGKNGLSVTRSPRTQSATHKHSHSMHTRLRNASTFRPVNRSNHLHRWRSRHGHHTNHRPPTPSHPIPATVEMSGPEYHHQ